MVIQRTIDPTAGACAVSLGKQSDATTAATLERSWSTIDKSIIVSANPNFTLWSNKGSLSGNREPDLFSQGNLEPIDLTFTFPEANADQICFVLAYALGVPSAPSQKGSTGIYTHAIRIIGLDVYERPLFTVCLRKGDETYGVEKLLLYGGQGQGYSIKGDRKGSSFINVSLTAQFLGKFKRNILRDVVYVSSQATSLTLSTHAIEGDDATARLKSIHAVIANLGGLDSRNYKSVEPTAASSATPAVITIPKIRSALTSVYSEVSSALTGYSDGSGTIIFDISDSDSVYIGFHDKFNALYFTSSVANSTAATMSMQYYAETGAWTSVGDLVDKTASGGATLAQSGHIFFNTPSDWEPVMLPYSASALMDITRQALYWVRMRASTAIDATTAGSIALSRYEDCKKVFFDDNGSFTDETTDANSMDGSEFPGADITTADYIYFRADGTSCARAIVEIGDTPNAVASTTMSIEYYNGSWTAVSGLSDGTDSGGISLAQNGEVTWTQPTDHQKVSVNSDSGYWFRMSFDQNLTAGARIEGLRVGDRYIPVDVTYRGKESVTFTEGDTFPAEVIQPVFPLTGVQFYVNPEFDGTKMHGGHKLECELVSFELTGQMNNPKPVHCIDGTQDKYPKKHAVGNPAQTIKFTIEANESTYQLLNHYSCENPSVTSEETVRSLAFGVRMTSAVIDTSYPEERYKVEMVYPKCAIKTNTLSEGDSKYLLAVEVEVGEDSTDSYKSVYARVVQDVSTAYAQ